MKNSAFFKIPLVVYPYTLLCFFNKSDSFVQKELKRAGGIIGIEECSMPDDAGGYYSVYSNNLCLIRMREIPTTCISLGILTHELLHVVLTVLDEVGMKVKIGSSDEAYTYLMGYLTEQTHRNLNKFY